MSVLDALWTFAVIGVPTGLGAGLLLGLVANRPEGLGGYGSLPRRAARLAHVAAVMLPLIAGFYALGFAARFPDADAPRLASVLWMGGAAGLVLTLVATALRPRARFALPLPATALVVAAALFAVALHP